MNTDTLTKLTDPELTQVIATAQGLLQTRADKRKSDAMEQIRQIAATVQINVSFEQGRKAKGSKPMLHAGDRYVNPADASQAHVVGKGKPPHWFVALRDKNKLPTPVASDSPKPREQ
jgi:ElaB/YqjD/DUF883 family membrane-anchored ribosome-binding protein